LLKQNLIYMQNPSLITRLATLTLFVSGMALFVAYEAGYFSKRKRPVGISRQNAEFRGSTVRQVPDLENPHEEVQTVFQAQHDLNWKVMSSSKSIITNHSGSAWMLPKSTPFILPSMQSLTANTSFQQR
jgi:hypothetical protein